MSPLTSRWRMLLVAVAAGVVAATLTGSPQSSAAGSVMFGANPGIDETGSSLGPLLDMEETLGRPLDIVRVYEPWDSDWSSRYLDEIEDSDRVMLISVKPKLADGTVIPWRDIADAPPGSTLANEMTEWVDRIEAFDGEVWFAFHHEPESSSNSVHGASEDFIDAWRRFIGEFQARGLSNVSYTWVMTYWSFATDPSDPRHVDNWYPGDDVVDHIASDAYNWDNCKGNDTDPWQPLEDVIDAQRVWGQAHPDKGLVLGEWASTEIAGDGGAAKAAWIAEAAALFKKPGWEQFVALMWFHFDDPSYPNCFWKIDTSEPALDAFVAMADDPFYGGLGGGGGDTPPDPGIDGFTDVDEADLFYADILWLSQEEITKGCNPPANDLFCPDDPVSRAQMAAFLVRALDYTDTGGGNLFVDDNTSIFETDIDKLATAGVTKGCNPPINDHYCPNAPVTRAQMAAFLVRALDYTDTGGGNLFVDDNTSIFETDIDKLATAGVTKGCNPPINDHYCPNAPVTRAQMAAFLHRALG